jgi:S1-C subfamily serine protease
MQITAPIFPGNSGGPVLNDRDEIVGIVSFVILDHGGSTHTMAGAVPWRVIVEALAGL